MVFERNLYTKTRRDRVYPISSSSNGSFMHFLKTFYKFEDNNS